jgi:hypothetical protein
MRPYQNLDDAHLVEEYAAAKAYADELYARLDDFKDELLFRFNESGQLSFENESHTVTMRKSPPSIAWLKREYGFGEGEVPAEVMTEKISLTPDWAKVKEWLEGQNMDWRDTYTPAIKAKPMKAPKHE